MGEEENWPSQSKMKVSTESMSSSAFWSGWAEARTANPSILDLLNFLLELVFHPKLTYPEQEQSGKLGEKWLKPKNLGMLRFKLEKDLDAFVEEATMSEWEAAVLVLLSISVYLFLFCSALVSVGSLRPLKPILQRKICDVRWVALLCLFGIIVHSKFSLSQNLWCSIAKGPFVVDSILLMLVVKIRLFKKHLFYWSFRKLFMLNDCSS